MELILATCVLVEHIFPFLDRATYDTCRFLNKDIFKLSEKVCNPAWPSHGSLHLQRDIACLAVCDQYLALGCETGEVIVVVRKTMQRFLLLETDHSMAIISIQFSPDETLLATGSVDGSIRLWRLCENPTDDPRSFCERLNSSTQTTRTPGFVPRKYDCPSILLPNYHHKPVHSLVFDPTSRYLISAAHEPTILVWNTQTGSFEQYLRDRWEFPRSLSLSPNGQSLAIHGSNGSLRLFSLSVLSPPCSNNKNNNHGTSNNGVGRAGGRTLDGGLPQHSEIQFSKDGQFLYARSGRQVHKWDIATGKRRSTWHWVDDKEPRPPPTIVVGTTMSPNGDVVAKITGDGRLVVTSTVAHSSHHHSLSVASAHPGQYRFLFTCDGRTIVTANCRRGLVEFWDTSL